MILTDATQEELKAGGGARATPRGHADATQEELKVFEMPDCTDVKLLSGCNSGRIERYILNMYLGPVVADATQEELKVLYSVGAKGS